MRSKIGQLLWISSQPRPDISYNTCQLATRLKSGTVKDLSEVNKLIRQLKSYSLQLRYIKLGKDKDLKIIVFTDGAHGNLADGGSQGGYSVFLVGENGKCSLISWQSKRICRVAKSSLAAETLSMSDGIDGAVFVNALLSKIYFGNTGSLPIEFITDNQYLVDALKLSKYVSDKCLRIEIGIVKEMVENKKISKIGWIESKTQIADIQRKVCQSTY